MRHPIRATHILSWVHIDSYFSQLICMHSHMPNLELKWPQGSQKWVTPFISLISVRMEKAEGQSLLRFGATGEEIQKYWIPKNWGGDRAERRAWSEPPSPPSGCKAGRNPTPKVRGWGSPVLCLHTASTNNVAWPPCSLSPSWAALFGTRINRDIFYHVRLREIKHLKFCFVSFFNTVLSFCQIYSGAWHKENLTSDGFWFGKWIFWR